MLFDRTRISYDMLCWRSGRWRRWRQGGQESVWHWASKSYVCFLFIYFSFVLFFFCIFFFTPTPAVITNLIPRRISEFSQGWHHGVTVARLPQPMRCDRGEVMISPAEPSMLLSIEDFSYSAAMPRRTSHFPLKEQFGWKWELCRYLLSSCLSKLVWRNFF